MGLSGLSAQLARQLATQHTDREWMSGVAAKLERRRIVERTARGRADAKAKGIKFGATRP